VIVPDGDAAITARLLRAVATMCEADYTVYVGTPPLRARYVPIPRTGPLVTWRSLADTSPTPRMRDLDLSLGDIELF
jgi:hypothetical protein